MRRHRRRIVLNLHGIGTPARPLETGEAAYWITEDMLRETIERVARARDRVDVHFTFDDGNASDLEIGAPALAEAGHAADVFVLTDRLDQPGSLGTDDLRRLQAMGHRIGSHGAAHCDWTAVPEQGGEVEFEAPRRILTRITGTEITAAAIPFGRYNRRVLTRLRRAGFRTAWSSDGGAWRNDRWPVPRTSLTAAMTGADIARLLEGTEPPLRHIRRSAARAWKRWI